MNPVITLLLLPAGLAGLSADQFQVLVEQLCQELAPATPLENVLVAQVASYLRRLRKAAMAEPEDKVNDRDWLRYHQMAERGFWKHYNELMKGRRQRARTTPKAAAPEIAPAPVAVAPTPAPVVAPTRTAAAPAPAPTAAPTAVAIPPSVEPRRRADRTATTEADRQRWRAECLALMAAQEPAGNSTFLPISITPAEPAATLAADEIAVGS